MMHDTGVWLDLLSQAPKGSILMGGAVIDFIAGYQPKDFDIFHSYELGEPIVPDNWVKTAVDYNDPVWIVQHNKDYMQGLGEQGQKVIGSVYEYLVDEIYLVQLIGVNYADPNEHFKNFDHSLTLGRFNKSGMFVHKKVFESLENNTIQYVSKNKSQAARHRSRDRALAKTNRYGGNWTLKGFG